jgi:hypothetical protein
LTIDAVSPFIGCPGERAAALSHASIVVSIPRKLGLIVHKPTIRHIER